MLEGNDGGIRSYHVVLAGLSQADNLGGLLHYVEIDAVELT